MEATKDQELEHIPTIKERGSNVYKPSDIKRWGVERNWKRLSLIPIGAFKS